MSIINKEWHAKNRMPANPTVDQRMTWHIEHAKHCTCRPIPEKLAAEISRWKSGRHSK